MNDLAPLPKKHAEHAAFATCPKGLEGLLLDELRSLGCGELKETVAGVAFSAATADLYRVCLWSRLANRVLLRLASFPIPSERALYDGVKAVAWDQHLRATGSIAIDFGGTTGAIKNSHFGALRSKDAIVDYFRERSGERPSVDKEAPDLRINIRAAKGQATVSIDLAGESLHRRGYRRAGGAAPLKENLAAAVLIRANWPGIAAAGGALIDPLCGSATLLIEGAYMALGIAPGVLRKQWSFERWLQHDATAWASLLDQARKQRQQVLSRAHCPPIYGCDASGKTLQMAEQNIAAAQLQSVIRVERNELAHFHRPAFIEADTGLVISNPPYGERLGDEARLTHLYQYLGACLKSGFRGWRAGVLTGNPALGKTMGLRSHKQYQLYNGTIPSKLLLFDVSAEKFVGAAAPKPVQADLSAPAVAAEQGVGVPARSDTVLSPGAEMFANRLRKNRKQLKKWLAQNEISCYRLYDADMPEYAVAVDVYDGWIHVAEYKAPAKVPEETARQRLREVMSALSVVLDVPQERIVVKERRRQRGKQQYRRREQTDAAMVVREGAVKLLVNLRDYLDTGLFLDHRRVRMHIAEIVAGKRFLNLFCYTGTATVHAAVGKASFSTSVDLSPTYLQWAGRNLALNGISENRHQLVQADCLQWLRENQQRYDVILLDPPTFSNSKRTDNVLDIQRDHADVIRLTMDNLARDGVLIFSTNKRKFALDSSLESLYQVDDKTAWSLDKDFQRGKAIHRCWFIRHRAES